MTDVRFVDTRDAAPQVPQADMNEYRAFVRRMATEGQGKAFFNTSAEHAAVAISEIFNESRKVVSLLTRGLSDDVYGKLEVMEAADAFLRQPDARIDIITEGAIDTTNNRFLAHTAAQFPVGSKVKWVRAPNAHFASNFAVGDAKHFRLEADADFRQAIIVFGEPVYGANLQSKFDSVWGSLEGSLSPQDAR